MESKSTQKLSRATAATILAASTVAVGLPMQTGAATTFKDVKQGEYYTDAVYELVNKGVINGYTDGTFKPNRNITRGEAAKMLAMALKLNLSNVQNNSFKDIKPTHMYYKHISALANAGIINGMPDGNFKPNEIVQRSAMAKMVSLGYKFSLATQLTHPFKDVSKDHFANYYIQTLLNLDITKGTSAVAFSPNAPVTRGQLATFISRASKADAGKPTYVVSNVTADKIYINSVGYTIGPNVRAFIKEANRSALLGAHIEGTFTGMTLTAVSKLTINNSGTASNLYVLDGANSTYNGQLVLNGGYIRLKNWTLNGQTLVAETPRKSLASYNVLSNLRIASLSGTGIIDWGTPTKPDSNSNLNDSDSGTLNSGSGNNRSYSAKMSSVQKYIDFTNAIVKNLTIEQNRTYIKATTDLLKVTIGRDVENVEIYADMKTLYLEGDTDVKIFGVHDIITAYKNSYYSVHFNTDAHIGTLIVDNSYGWIDLSEHVNIDKVIIPAGKTPNDIFDDYKNDNDNIGIIEDNKGDDVDRDPIENEIIPDVTKPIINDLRVAPDSNQAEVTLTVNETGKYHYLVLPKDATVPTVRDIVSTQSGNSGSGTVSEGHVNSDGKYTTTFLVKGLESVTEYVIYVVHVDDTGNFSARLDRDFVTKDGTPPQFMTATATGLAGGRRIQFDFKPSETGTYYYFLDERLNPDESLTVDDVISRAQHSGTVTPDHVVNGYSNIITEINSVRIKPLTDYVLYAVLVDNSENKIREVESFKVTTLTLDETPPVVTDGILHVKDPLNNEFYLEVSEELDKATVENINNYVLSGTGIINYGNQREIRPEKVVYDKARKQIILTIPSFTGFVNGDNLIVTVLPAVKDLADNAFENKDNMLINQQTPRNKAEYLHSDLGNPILTLIGKPVIDPLQTKAIVEFNASKAGTYHYLIMESGVELENIDGKELVKAVQNQVTSFTVNGTSYDVVGRGGNYPAQIGSQAITVPFPNKSTLSPFKSYDIYLVIRDRSGNLSLVKSNTFIADLTAPTIESPTVNINEGDTSGRMVFNSNEAGTLYYIYRKLDDSTNTLMPGNANDLANYLRVNGKEQELRVGANNILFDNLERHKDYEVHFAVVDLFGNTTVYENERMDASGNIIRDTTKMLNYKFYADGTKPFVDKVIKRQRANNSIFEVTFSEQVGSNFNFKLTDSSGTIPSNTYSTAWTTATNSFDSRKLLITFTNPRSTSFSMTVDTTATDKGSSNTILHQQTPLEFSTNEAQYMSRLLVSKFYSIELKNPLITAITSKTIDATLDLPGADQGYDNNEVLNYYAVAYTATTDESIIQSKTVDGIKAEVLNTQVSATLGNKTGTISTNAARKTITFTHSEKFATGDWIVIVLEDKYGNMSLIYQKVGYVFQ